jgi:2-iminobutanoate/2-iminopropanoate deaminase
MTMTWTPPLAARRGQYVLTSTLYGDGPDGRFDPDPALQMRTAFAKLPVALSSVGATLDEVVQVGVHVSEHGIRDTIDPPWIELYPQPTRPARRTTRMRLPNGAFCGIQAGAVVGGKRTNYENPGLSHRNPLPMGAKVGNLFVSSSVNGQVPNGPLPKNTAEQIDQAYLNVKSLLAQAGGTLDDIVHMWVFMKEELAIDTLVEKWLGVFPREGDRPARKTFLRSDLAGEQQVQMQFTALLGSGKRTNHEVPDVHHRDPIPMGARIGDLFMSSGIPGAKPNPTAPASGASPPEQGLENQLHWGLENLETMMRLQGGSLENVAHLGVLVSNYDVVPALYEAIAKRFPNRPSVHLWGMPVPTSTMLVQFYATAVF